MITKKQFAAEFADLAHEAGVRDLCAIDFPRYMRERNEQDPRAFAEVDPWELRFNFAPQVLELPAEHRRGLIMHELGHWLCRDLPDGGTEEDADAAAGEAFGVVIQYDCRWPGKGLQRVNPSAQFAWHCPSPPRQLEEQALEKTDFGIVDYIHDHAEEITPDEFAQAVGGWDIVARDWYGGGEGLDAEFMRNDWSVSWYRSNYPDGTPIVFHTASGIEHVYELPRRNPPAGEDYERQQDLRFAVASFAMMNKGFPFMQRAWDALPDSTHTRPEDWEHTAVYFDQMLEAINPNTLPEYLQSDLARALKALSELTAKTNPIRWSKKQIDYMEGEGDIREFVVMPAKDFLYLLTTPRFRDDQEGWGTMEDFREDAAPLDAYNKGTAAGKINLGPFLKIGENGRVINHEGRHRAAALMNAEGEDAEMVVAIRSRSKAYKRAAFWKGEFVPTRRVYALGFKSATPEQVKQAIAMREEREERDKRDENPKNFDQIERAYEDWAFRGGFDIIFPLEDQGYKWVYLMRDASAAGIKGEHVIVTDEMPGWDVIVTKKFIAPTKGMVMISPATRKEFHVQNILRAYAGTDTVVLAHKDRDDWAALVHPATRPGVEWQGTMFDTDGPYGHIEGETREGVIRRLVDERQYTKPDPDAMKRVLGAQASEGRDKRDENPGLSPDFGEGWMSKEARDLAQIAVSIAGFDPRELAKRLALAQKGGRSINVKTVERILGEMDEAWRDG